MQHASEVMKGLLVGEHDLNVDVNTIVTNQDDSSAMYIGETRSGIKFRVTVQRLG